MKNEKITLSPCPFCGAEAKLSQVRCTHNHDYFRDGHWYINVKHDDDCILYTSNFAARGAYDKVKGIYKPPTERVIKMCEKWNKRAKEAKDDG